MTAETPTEGGPALNLPIAHRLAGAERILLAGAGGGYDVYGALPLLHELRAAGKEVHLANYSFVDPRLATRYAKASEVVLEGLLVGVRGPVHRSARYFPEGHLSEWLVAHGGYERPIWLIDKRGVPGVKAAYRALVDRLALDAIVLCDGGVDSLMRGDEEGAGTYVEDTISIAAVAELDFAGPRLLGAIGVGSEVEEGVSHYRALENIAALARDGGFLGSCSLVPEMPAFRLYERAASELFQVPEREVSRIHSRIVPSIRGEFGAHNWLAHPRQPFVFHSPLMGIYWFFDLLAVHGRSLVAAAIRDAETFGEALQAARVAVGTRAIEGRVRYRDSPTLPLK